MNADDPYEQSLKAALREQGVDWLAEIQRHRLLINCSGERVVIHTAEGTRVSGTNLREVLQQVIQPTVPT